MLAFDLSPLRCYQPRRYSKCEMNEAPNEAPHTFIQKLLFRGKEASSQARAWPGKRLIKGA